MARILIFCEDFSTESFAERAGFVVMGRLARDLGRERRRGDVQSSPARAAGCLEAGAGRLGRPLSRAHQHERPLHVHRHGDELQMAGVARQPQVADTAQIGRASCRERVFLSV